MKNLLIAIILIISLTSFIGKNDYYFENSSKSIKVIFTISSSKTVIYKVYYNDNLVIGNSELGVIRSDADFYTNLEIISVSKPETIASTYTMLQGKRKNIHYKANQYTVHLKNNKGNLIDIIFKLSEDGIALRYVFPEKSIEIKKIIEEKTSFNFDNESKAWLQPMSKAKTGWKETNPSYEENYVLDVPVNSKSVIGEGWVFPALFKSNTTWILISETGLQENYCGSHLNYNDSSNSMQLVFPQKEEQFQNDVLYPESKLPWATPWRIIAIGSLKTICESTLGTDLAEPEITMDKSFIKSGLASWSWALLKDDSVNFETSIKFIDYAADMNWSYCLIDVDWNKRIGFDKMKELATYAKNKNIKLIAWYNSSGSWNSTTYEPKSKLLSHSDREKEFSLLNEMGISGIKVDFFGGDGQSMIAYYQEILKDAASHKLVVNFHGATPPTGLAKDLSELINY